jgi:hypothetical protein
MWCCRYDIKYIYLNVAAKLTSPLVISEEMRISKTMSEMLVSPYKLTAETLLDLIGQTGLLKIIKDNKIPILNEDGKIFLKRVNFENDDEVKDHIIIF